jgi:hypothetical protein
MRYIRYYEDGIWKYASVKTVGDIEKLKTSAKGSVVEAINSLIDGGVLEIVSGDLSGIRDDLAGQSSTIATIQQLQNALAQKEEELRQKQQEILADLSQTVEDVIKKADLTYVDGQLVKKIDVTTHQQKYDELKNDLLTKVSLETYQEQYASLVEEVSKKANDIDIQSIIDSVNQDITDQQIEIDSAKTNIVNLDKKVDTVKSDVLNTVDGVMADVDELNSTIANQKTAFDKQISDTQTKATNDLANAKSELESSIGSVEAGVTTLTNNLDATKTDLQGQISAEIASRIQDIADINSKLSGTQSELESAKDTISNTQQTLSQTKSELDGTRTTLQETKNELDDIKNNVVFKVEIISSNGNVFKNGQFNTTLEARVYRGTEDVTDTINASRFRWYRASMDAIADMNWNSAHAGGAKSITITPQDVYGRATFSCEVLEEEV